MSKLTLAELDQELEQEFFETEERAWAEEENKKECTITELELELERAEAYLEDAEPYPYDSRSISFYEAAKARLDRHVAQVKNLLADQNFGIRRRAQDALMRAEGVLKRAKS